MLAAFRRWRENRVLQRSRISEAEWTRSFSQLPLLQRLTAEEAQRLRRLAVLLLHEKTITAADDFSVDEAMQIQIALLAALPILNLGLEWYRDWQSIIVYPGDFIPQHEVMDESGVVHIQRRVLSGEAWERGPVILSWKDVIRSKALDGDNVVIHEFAHKLDMRNGIANGFPPLHADMDGRHWTEVFSEAFEDFRIDARTGVNVAIDPYAAYSPEEFFAVLSEVFFERPEIIFNNYPEVYSCLRDFYRQDPLSGFAGSNA